MSFLRFLSRSMLASYFIADGFRGVVDPTPVVPVAEPIAEKVSDLAQGILPADVARRIPTDTTSLVRIHGGIQILGALMMATGIGRRAGAALLGLAYLPKVLGNRPASPNDIHPDFLRDVALLGAILIEMGDTQGRPNLAWLASAQGRRVKKASEKSLKAASVAIAKPIKVGQATAKRQVEALRDALAQAGQ